MLSRAINSTADHTSTAKDGHVNAKLTDIASATETACKATGAGDAEFHFRRVPTQLPAFEDRDIKDYLQKWGFHGRTYVTRFSYDAYFQPYQTDVFLHDFFNDPEVLAEFKVTDTNGNLIPLGSVKATRPRYEKLEATVTSMSFFDRLQTAGITRDNGSIVKCFDTYLVNGELVCDELGKCLLEDPEAGDEGKYAGVFPAQTDGKELLFRVFRALALGGYLTQYEDDVGPYLDATKAIYKDLVSVHKRASSGELEVISHAYSVEDFTSVNDASSAAGEGGDGKSIATIKNRLFPCDNARNFCLLTVEPVRRWVTVWYHASPSYY